MSTLKTEVFGELVRVRNSKELRDLLKKKIANLVFDTQRVILENTPVRTGRLRQSIRVEKTSDGWIIGTNVPYAEYVEFGVGLFGPKHEPIRPVRAKALHWVDDRGRDVFAKEVKGFEGSHMFLKGYDYFVKNLRKVQEELKK